MAPEVLEHNQYDGKADVFSFAVTIWELTTARVPHEGMSPIQVWKGLCLSHHLRSGISPPVSHASKLHNLDHTQVALGVIQRGLRPEFPALPLYSASVVASPSAVARLRTQASPPSVDLARLGPALGSTVALVECAADGGAKNEAILDSADHTVTEAVYSGLVDLVGRCWAQNPKDRPQFDQVLSGLRALKERLTAAGHSHSAEALND